MGIISGIINLNQKAVNIQNKAALKAAVGEYVLNNLKEEITSAGYMLQANLQLKQQQAFFKQSIDTSNLKIVADARLDNRAEIEKKLGLEKHLFSNEDLIILLYKKYGVDLLAHLIGAFAFVIFDETKDRIFMARDQMGVKPLYYYFKDECLAFATEKTPILSLDFVDKQVDWQFMLKHLTKQMSVSDTTEHLYIKMVQPAHYFIIDKNKFKQQRYWDLDVTKEIIYKNDEDYVAHFQEIFEETIACRLADVDSVGSHLSGGLDSGGITGVAKVVCDRLNKPLSTFSYTYDDEIKRKLKHPDKNFDYINIINQQIEFSNIEFAYKISDPINRSQYKCVQHEAKLYGGLSWSENVNTEYEIQVIAKQHKVNMIFSGFAGDELVTSFVRPYYLEYLDRGQWLKFFKSKHRGKYKPHYLAGLAFLKLMHSVGVKNTSYLSRFYQKNFRSKTLQTQLKSLSEIFAPDYLNENKDLQKALTTQYDAEIHENIPLSLKAYQRNHILRPWTARRMNSENTAARYFNLEYRYPLADIRLLEFVLAIPVEQKRNETTERLMFRKGIAKYVHPQQANVQKKLSSLKPLIKKIDYNKDLSLQKMWNEIKDTATANFLNKNLLNEISTNAPQNLNQLYHFFVLAELVENRKLKV